MGKKHKRHNAKGRKQIIKPRWPVLFYIFMILAIFVTPVIYVPTALDPALHPRLLFLSVFLFIFTILLLFKRVNRQFDFTILKHTLFYILLAYFVITCISSLFAINYRESFFDINKSFAILTFTAFTCFVFLRTDRWWDRLPV
nr:hypothetical protein [Bacteroidota bacterium]